MSNINSIRTGIHTALAAISGLETVQRYDAFAVEDALEIAKRRPCIVVVSRGLAKGNGPLSQLKKNTLRYLWTLVIVTDDMRDAVGAVRAAEDLVELALEIREDDVHTIADEPVRLRLVEGAPQRPPDRPVEGGPCVYPVNFETTEVLA